MQIVNWLGQQFMQGCQWLLEKGAIGILGAVGGTSRFMTEECPEAFILFGIIGVFFIMASSKEKGMKMINLSVMSFIIMKVLGVAL